MRDVPRAPLLDGPAPAPDHRGMNASAAIEAARAALDDMGGHGASIAARQGGRTVFATGVGFRDLARTVSYDRDEAAWIYSITKTLMAALIMRRVETDALDLDAPALRWAPGFGLNEDVKLAHLLNHTAGLPDYGDLPAYHADLRARPDAPWSDEAFIARTVRARPPRGAPGREFAYSNIGYAILRAILERSGPLAELLRAELFAPLGCTQARLAERLEDCAGLPPGWSRALGSGATLIDVSGIYDPRWVSHRAVIATAAETAALLDAILDARSVSAASRDRMCAPFPVAGAFPPFTTPNYGLGLMIDTGTPFGPAIGHGGGGPGFSCAAFRFTDLDTTIVALANSDTKDFGAHLVFAMARALAG